MVSRSRRSRSPRDPVAHLSRSFPDAHIAVHHYVTPPVATWNPEFAVARLEPAAPDGMCAYVTIGATTLGDPRPEFFLLSEARQPHAPELLAMVANFHNDPGRALTVGSVVNIGAPWSGAGTPDHLVVSLPYPIGPALEWRRDRGGWESRYLWLLPVWGGEAEFVRQHGLDAFESLMEATHPNILDPRRVSVI